MYNKFLMMYSSHYGKYFKSDGIKVANIAANITYINHKNTRLIIPYHIVLNTFPIIAPSVF